MKRAWIGLLMIAGVTQVTWAQDYNYIERSWDGEKVVSEQKTLHTGEYTSINGNDTSDKGWVGLANGWYVVTGNSSYKVLKVIGNNVHLIIPDGITLTVTGGVKVELKDNAVLNIYGQVLNSGQLIATNSYSGAAGIGSGGGSDDGDAGMIIIHGGTINATGNKYGAGIGGGDKHGFGLQSNNSGLTVYGGTVTAQGGEFAAGIGSGDEPGKDRHAGYVVVYGGTVNATGGDEGAGIGGGNECHGALVNIYGGTVNATGGRLAAAIGGGDEGAGNQCNIHGGTVTARGGYAGAGIGGGEGGNGGYVNIYGGTVTATSEIEERNNQEPFPSLVFGGGAGIGGGTDGNSGNIVISGGNVTAKGGGCYQTDNEAITRGAAGIGGGVSGGSGTITISGGNVSATSFWGGAGIGPGEHCGSKVGQCNIIISGGTVEANAIGEEPGAGIGYSHAYFGGKVKITITGGTIFARSHYHLSNSFLQAYPCPDQYSIDDLTIPDGHKVRANINNVPKDEGGFYDKLADERKKVMTTYQSVWIEPCDHSRATYTVSGTTGNDTHTKHCNYCTTAFEPEKHTFKNGKCTVCGVGQSTYTITVNVPANNGATDGVYEAVTYQMVPGTTFKLPASPTTFSDRVFAGWLVGEAKNSSYRTSDYEELLSAGDEYTINDDVTFTARYSYVYITLNDNADNSEMLSRHTGMTATVVTLKDRTLYKDGRWNTLCLPFSLSSLTGTPLAGATVKTLESSAFNENNGTLTLNFSDASKIEAGKPYLVKWASTGGTNLTVIQFGNVTISNTTTDVKTDEVTFKGIFSPYAISGEDKTILYIDADNKLCYPNAAMTIGACRAYFQLQDGLTAGESSTAGAKSISHIVLNFGDGVATGITNTNFTDGTDQTGGWYDLSGRRLAGQPSAKGIYINNGLKIVIK